MSIKIDIYSDTHLDAWARKWGFSNEELRDKLLSILTRQKVGDYAIFAGDAGNGMTYYELFNDILGFVYGDDNVFSVIGNHEPYGEDWDANDPRFTEVRSVKWEGIRVIGACLWTNCREDHASLALASRYINDWFQIPCLKDSSTNGHWRKPRDWFRTTVLRLYREKADVVVTHFAPLKESEHEKYKDNLLNPYFVNDIPDLVDEISPSVWVHGHTHSEFDYKFNDTRVVCSPFGYPGENFGSLDDMKPKTIEVSK